MHFRHNFIFSKETREGSNRLLFSFNLPNSNVVFISGSFHWVKKQTQGLRIASIQPLFATAHMIKNDYMASTLIGQHSSLFMGSSLIHSVLK